MIPVISIHPAYRCSTQRRVTKSPTILPIIACAMACVSCNEQGPPILDVTPLGDAMKVIAYAIPGVGVLGVLGKLVK